MYLIDYTESCFFVNISTHFGSVVPSKKNQLGNNEKILKIRQKRINLVWFSTPFFLKLY